jgi:hypothetical protein
MHPCSPDVLSPIIIKESLGPGCSPWRGAFFQVCSSASHGAEMQPGATRNGQELLVPRAYSCMFLSSIVSGPSGAWCSIMRCQLLLYCIHVRTAGFWLITQNLWIFRRATQLFVSCIPHLSSINASFGSCQATLPCPSILALPFLLVGISFISRDIKIETWRQALHRSVRCF